MNYKYSLLSRGKVLRTRQADIGLLLLFAKIAVTRLYSTFNDCGRGSAQVHGVPAKSATASVAANIYTASFTPQLN